jgi:hypothetical protein
MNQPKIVFGHYARILVDMDLSQQVFDEVMVEREGYAFNVNVIYERLPEFCSHCKIIGHSIAACKWVHPVQETNVQDCCKKIAVHGQKAVHVMLSRKKRRVKLVFLLPWQN